MGWDVDAEAENRRTGCTGTGAWRGLSVGVVVVSVRTNHGPLSLARKPVDSHEREALSLVEMPRSPP